MPNLHLMATRLARRPLLLAPDDALALGNRLANLDPALIENPRRFGILTRMRRTAARVLPSAFEDDGGGEALPASPLAYEPMWAGEVDDYLEYGLTLKDGVAMLNIDTPIAATGEDWCGTWFHGYDSIDAAIKTALADNRVKAIFIRMDSPGGVVAGGIDQVAQTMRANREAAGGKPIWVFADFCCSAAYWIAAQADRIIAPREGIVGSIGAVIVHMEATGALAKAGVTVTPIQFGAHKTAGADFQELTDGAKADMQAWVDQCGRNFVAAVTEGRPALTEEALLATEARIFMGDHDDPERSGLSLKFVDAVQGEADCFAALLDHVTPANNADAPAIPVASSQPKETAMSKRKPGAPKRATARPRSAILASMAASQKKLEDDQDDLDALEEEEMATEDIDSLPEGEGEDDQPDAEDDDPAVKKKAKPDPDAPAAMDDDDDDDEEEDEDDAPVADKEMLAAALTNFAPNLSASARAIAAEPGMTFTKGKARLAAMRKDVRLAARADHKVSGMSGGKGIDSQKTRMKAATAEINEKRAKARKRR